MNNLLSEVHSELIAEWLNKITTDQKAVWPKLGYA